METQLGSEVIALSERKAEVEFQVDVTGESLYYKSIYKSAVNVWNLKVTMYMID